MWGAEAQTPCLHMGQFWRFIVALEHPGRLAVASVKTVSQLRFSLCPIWFVSPFHRYYSQRHSPINILYMHLYVRIYYPRNMAINNLSSERIYDLKSHRWEGASYVQGQGEKKGKNSWNRGGAFKFQGKEKKPIQLSCLNLYSITVVQLGFKPGCVSHWSLSFWHIMSFSQIMLCEIQVFYFIHEALALPV